MASRQGPPLTEPPAYGEASPALEHLVLYDDGSSEWLTLKNEKVRYVQATRAAQLVGQVTASLSADDDMSWFAAPVAACVEILCFNVGSRAVGVRCRSRDTVSYMSRRSWPSLGLSEERRHDDGVEAHSLLATQVEAEALGLVDYHNVITEPMDLGTVDDRVEIFKLLQFGVCCSLYAVACIPRRSCPSLGRKHESRDSRVDVHTGRRPRAAGLL